MARLARRRTIDRPASAPSVTHEDVLAGPMRGELFGAEHLNECARELAAEQRVGPWRERPRTSLLARLAETAIILRRAHEMLSAHDGPREEVGPAGEWLLDNHHVLQAHMLEVRESLPRGYYRELPTLEHGPLAGYPRVYEIATTLIAHTEGRVDRENVSGFLAAFQERVHLTLGELWAVPLMLRLGTIENVRRMTQRTTRRLHEIARADAHAARIVRAASRSGAALEVELARFGEAASALSDTFVARFLRQLRLEGSDLPTVVRLQHWIADEALSAEAAAARATERLALTHVMMANSITSLRAIDRINWRALVEAASVVETVLRSDPMGTYAQMTFGTRDAYRHVVERLARRTGRSEEAVAREAIACAREVRPGASAGTPVPDASTFDVRTHVGYHLIDDGLVPLEVRLGYRVTWSEAVHRWIRRHPTRTYLGAIALATGLVLLLLPWLAGTDGWPQTALVLLLGALPASAVGIALVHTAVTEWLPPRRLPRLDLREHGVSAPYTTAVVVPTLLRDVADVHAALENLEVQFLANREPHLHFALLSDFTDAATERVDGDEAILVAATEGIHALNARHAPQRRDAFHLFHRPRRWNPREGTWMGWERKRGKLGEFNRFVLEGVRDGFCTIEGEHEVLRTVRYVITLDADTQLPPDAAPLLIGALAHPLNRVVSDPRTGRVLRGYGILQPRVGVSLPSARRSRFASIHAGAPGVDPYTTAVSDVYQDLFGQGSFTGKGVYDVAVFEHATRGRFPENTLLSHDLIEGNYARAGLATDVMVHDDYPARYLTYARRRHRWLRGDWQLLPWLGRVVPGPAGPERNHLSLLSRWKLFDNLRRSLVEPAQLLFLAVGWVAAPTPVLRWSALGLALIAAPWILPLLVSALRPPRDRSWRAYYGTVRQDAGTSLQQLLLAVLLLPHQAWMSVDAIARTLWRMAVSRRHLLEWTSAQASEREAAGSAHEAWGAMWPISAAAALACWPVLAVVLRPSATGIAATVGGVAPFLLAWLASPALAHWLSRPRATRPAALSTRDQQDARRYALAHWQYFERFVSAETHWLAPDNHQGTPESVLALRTSPTNIGLHLLAIVSAHDLGFITRDDMLQRLARAAASLQRLPRRYGHYFNWYDLRDLSVLEPAYISTVDSGNLAGHLLALRQACLAMAHAEDTTASQRAALQALATWAHDDVLRMQFDVLFDPDRELFSIGLQGDTDTRDASYYDLLASEARMASFVAIAKNDVPADHWFRLGRLLTHTAGAPALVSWSGSMFEYLMPLLVMRALPGTLLAQAAEGAVERHEADGAAHDVPWGISESAWNVRDRHQTYQYRPFGVADLALKRGLRRDLVVAPYASALALMVRPAEALANLRRLEALGALTAVGFTDALDFTRPAPGKRFALVDTQMAHHVGMTLVALTNVLTGHAWPDRFHADALVKSAELLLHERTPRAVQVRAPAPDGAEEALLDPSAEPVVRAFPTADTPTPHVAFLGHRPYTVMLTNAGAGYSRHGLLAVNRWRADGTRDATGQFCYIKDLASGRVWSSAHQPTGAIADAYRASLGTERVTFERTDGDIVTCTEIAVVPEDSAEVRRLTLTNTGRTDRELELTSYGELVLTTADADRAHPAFSKLFVETEWNAWCSAITATRRARASTESACWFVHLVDGGPDRVGEVTCETDRARFVGRGRSARDPIALEVDGALSGTVGAVLDPVFALRTRVRLAPGQQAKVAFTTLIAETRAQAFALADRYRDPYAAQRALDLAWTSSQAELQELALTPADAATAQELAGHLLYGHPALRAPQGELQRNRGSQPLLWTLGVSGDAPILLATIGSEDGLPTLRALLAAHRFWRRRGLTVDLVVLDVHPPSYLQDLADRIAVSVHAVNDADAIDRTGGVFVRRRALLSSEVIAMLRATARLHVPCDGRPLDRILAATIASRTPGTPVLRAQAPPPPRRERRRTPRAASAVTPIEARHANGIGALRPDNDYELQVRGDALPPAPWANVIANPKGGFVITERGGGCVWAESSAFLRLTPWHNDPVSDPVGDALYLQDVESGDCWGATPAPIRTDSTWTIRHGAGRTTFTHERHGIAVQYVVGMAPDDAVKLGLLTLRNTTPRPRRLVVTSYVEWVLGALREETQHQVRTWFDASTGALLAGNSFGEHFADWIAFHRLTAPVTEHTGSRRHFLGRNGTTANPAALAPDAVLSAVTGAGIDPCAALRCVVELAPGAEHDVGVLLGAAGTAAAATEVMARYDTATTVRAALDASTRAWAARLGAVAVRTPVPTFDAMLNRWSLYQTISCRLWGRTALYQSGGAYGFRDQLQDVMALVHSDPALAREQILRAASRQFLEGDVQHWWHPHSGRGVRTRFSDDLVWLPHVVAQYVETTGDATILEASVPYLTMRALLPHEHDVYDLPAPSDVHEGVYEHGLRALRRACTHGVHGLPLIGGGDWNDGLNRVGVEGRGESVWLAWFLIATLRAYAALAAQRGDDATASALRAQAEAYAAAVEQHGWDGAWYRRAFYDDGTPLGSHVDTECRIDSLAQSWSVLSRAGRPTRQVRAMQAVETHLVKRDDRLILLLTPPFDRTPHDPGYIKGYLPGVRENGAQYTHAAWWVVLATAMQGHGDAAFRQFQLLNPLEHARTPADVATYRVEPYVVAADVYSATGQVGRGGWTWYTGAASWMYRVGLEGILGLERRGDRLSIAPRAPAAWQEYLVQYRVGASRYDITVRCTGAERHATSRVVQDGVVLRGVDIPLVDDGAVHQVEVWHDALLSLPPAAPLDFPHDAAQHRERDRPVRGHRDLP
jgi:cyclic beta-1,2-glucan synthetase